jgi:hypothetical protein
MGQESLGAVLLVSVDEQGVPCADAIVSFDLLLFRRAEVLRVARKQLASQHAQRDTQGGTCLSWWHPSDEVPESWLGVRRHIRTRGVDGGQTSSNDRSAVGWRHSLHVTGREVGMFHHSEESGGKRAD